METNLFSGRKISSAYLRMSLPLVLSMAVTLIYNLADTYFVARTNDANLVAGVSLCAPVFTVLMAMGNIFGQGGSSLISRLLGSGSGQGARRVSSFCFYATLFGGVAVGVLMLALRAPLLRLIGADADTYAHASDYFTWLALGAPAVMLSFIHSNLLRSEGMSRESMLGTVGGALVNIVLDPIFISTLGMGARGAAIATVIGYVFSDVFFAVIVIRRSAHLSVWPVQVRACRAEAAQIFGIGIPAAIVNVMQSASVVLMNQYLLPYGNEKIAAMGIALKVSMIALLLLTGFAFGGQPLFGYFYGARNRQRLAELFGFCMRFIVALAVLLAAAIFAAAPLLMRCFMSDAGIVADGAQMLRFQAVTIPLVGALLLMTIAFQSIGKVAGSFVLSISRQGVVFVVALLCAQALAGYTGVIAAQAIADVATAFIAVALFFTTLRGELYGASAR